MLSYYPNTFKLVSTNFDTSTCKYQEGTCEVEGHRLIWTTNCAGKCQPCHYMPLGSFSGVYSENTFLSYEKQIELSFHNQPQEASDCLGDPLVVSDQGYAIRRSDYDL